LFLTLIEPGLEYRTLFAAQFLVSASNLLLSKMCAFAETAIVDYRLSFADQGKQTSVIHFRLHQTKTEVFRFRFPIAANKQKLYFSFSSVSRIYVPIYIYAAVSNYIGNDEQTVNGLRKIA
jgi:hypothetical protein